MAAFRFVALAYALLVLLIAPSWLAADEDAVSVPPVPEVEAPAEVQDAVDQVEAQLPALKSPAGGTPPADAQGGEEPEVAPEPKARRAKAEDKERERTQQEEPTARAAADASVTIRDFEFAPTTVTVNVGDTVTWTNDGPTVHTATAEDGSFDTGILRRGESGSATFNQAGTIAYICTPHPYMKATVVVQAARADGDGSGPSGSSGTGTGSDDGFAVAGDTLSSDDGSGLPATGSELLLIALFGVVTLAAGVLLRRRAQA